MRGARLEEPPRAERDEAAPRPLPGDLPARSADRVRARASGDVVEARVRLPRGRSGGEGPGAVLLREPDEAVQGPWGCLGRRNDRARGERGAPDADWRGEHHSRAARGDPAGDQRTTREPLY